MAPSTPQTSQSRSPQRILPGTNDAETSAISRKQRPRTTARLTDEDVLQHAYGIPTLRHVPQAQERSSTAEGKQNGHSKARKGHGRSLSHPFPSLFSGKKKKQDAEAQSVESTDDEVTSPEVQSPSKSTSRRMKVAPAELMTGKCMTCESTVRWPKELQVFRCTVCLTINDLKDTEDHEAQPVNGYLRGALPPHEAVTSLSVERTSAIIETCIRAYLDDQLNAQYLASHSTDQRSISRYENEHRDYHETCHTTTSFQRRERSMINTPPITISAVGDDQRMDTGTYFNKAPTSSSSTRILSTSMPGEHESRPNRRLQSDTGQGAADMPPTRSPPLPPSPFPWEAMSQNNQVKNEVTQEDETKRIFKPLEDYIVRAFSSRRSINSSFSTSRSAQGSRTASQERPLTRAPPEDDFRNEDASLALLDPKLLLIGNIAENGAWWGGNRSPQRSVVHPSRTHESCAQDPSDHAQERVSVRSPKLDWAALEEWYDLVCSPCRGWEVLMNNWLQDQPDDIMHTFSSPQKLEVMETCLMDSQAHVHRVLLKATETLLKRPGAPVSRPADMRFLLILLSNPLLYPAKSGTPGTGRRSPSKSFMDMNAPRRKQAVQGTGFEVSTSVETSVLQRSGGPYSESGPGKHSGILKRILGLLSNLSNECHRYLVAWFARLRRSRFLRLTELIGSFVTYRLTRQHGKPKKIKDDPTAGLIPSITSSGRSTSAALHAALGVSGQTPRQSDGKPKPVVYNDDWQIKAAARVMALLFSANNSGITNIRDVSTAQPMDTLKGRAEAARESAHRHGQIIATSDFYNTLLDYSDLIADFEAWEAKRGKFAFCQYPFFLSIWAKIQIMEYDARRQMEIKAREAFFDSIMTRKNLSQYLVLKIRRECLVEDSLKGVSEVVGSGGEDIKKGLRIEFIGEEGIDAGGLRKEWFLLLVRDVFNPEHGMFVYDDESQYCYFNPFSFETSDQFFLVGVVLGLAIYNSTILDVALPPFAFRKLLAASPSTAGTTLHAKPVVSYTLEDLEEFRPSLARGLRQLLEYDGDVENTFCRDFVADVERYGKVTQIPLCPDGEKRPVTNSNRREFVDLYVRYLLDTAVTRQFEPLKRGFFTVCGGNALSLFRPEEIELLVRGSDEPLDIASLRAVAVYDNWGTARPVGEEPVIAWFWQSFANATPKDQRKLLGFITGSDRIPAMGAANLVMKIICLGDDERRFPIARTCFNVLALWRYGTYEKLDSMLWRAVWESEGFGLK